MPRKSEYAITIEDVSKSFGQTKVVKNTSLKILPGEIFTLIGPNGAGKTTLVKMMTGLLRPDKGSITLYGHSIVATPEVAKEYFGYVSDNPSPYDYLTGEEFLALTGRLRGMSPKETAKRIKDLSQLFPIGIALSQPLQPQSRGTKQKIAFLAALMDNPEILIIDEPIVGLDPDGIEIFGKTLKQFAKAGGTVFMVTHILSFAKLYSTRVAVMQNGRISGETAVRNVGLIENYYAKYTK
jgi:ABC-2 type transport system ATP-binding protein